MRLPVEAGHDGRLLILIHVLVLFAEGEELLEEFHAFRLKLTGIHQLLVVLPPERRLRSSGMNMEGVQWSVSRKSMASCHLVSQSSSWVITLALSNHFTLPSSNIL